MKKRFKAILVDTVSLYENNSTTKYDIYSAVIPFKDLIEICKIKSISTNREVDEVRALKMKDYIKQSTAFYPPLIISTDRKGQLVHNELTSEMTYFESENYMTIIDGQHRFKSIELLLMQNEVIHKKQSVFILDGISDLKRREVFIDINDKAKRVSTGDKARYSLKVSNYLSLKFIEEKFNKERIDWGATQFQGNGKYPYKFVEKGSEQLLKDIEKDYKKGDISLEDLSGLEKIIFHIWNRIIIKTLDANEDNNFLKTEIFIHDIIKSFKSEFDIIKLTNNKTDDEKTNLYIQRFNEIFDKYLAKNKEIDELNIGTITEKRDKLYSKKIEWGWINE
jgi:hypothetical protein